MGSLLMKEYTKTFTYRDKTKIFLQLNNEKSCFSAYAPSNKSTWTWTRGKLKFHADMFFNNIKDTKCFPGLTAVIVSIPSVVWCEIHCGVPSLVSQHQTPVWSWSQRHGSNSSCSSQHYIKTKITEKAPLSGRTSRSVYGLCSGSGRFDVLGENKVVYFWTFDTLIWSFVIFYSPSWIW